MAKPIRSHRDLDVYKTALTAAFRIFRLTKAFPPDERWEQKAQIISSSRAVCRAIAEAWRKRRYPAAWVAKLSEAESEAAETQTSLEFALDSGYITATDFPRTG